MTTITPLRRFLFETRDTTGEKITQADVAAGAGIGAAAISDICSGKSNPSIETAAAIVTYLRERTGQQVSMDEFWGTEQTEAKS
jgi:transcriptional regulator with XRE-family HTH domain